MIKALPYLLAFFFFWIGVCFSIDYIYDKVMALYERWKREHRRSHR